MRALSETIKAPPGEWKKFCGRAAVYGGVICVHEVGALVWWMGILQRWWQSSPHVACGTVGSAACAWAWVRG